MKKLSNKKFKSKTNLDKNLRSVSIRKATKGNIRAYVMAIFAGETTKKFVIGCSRSETEKYLTVIEQLKDEIVRDNLTKRQAIVAREEILKELRSWSDPSIEA